MENDGAEQDGQSHADAGKTSDVAGEVAAADGPDSTPLDSTTTITTVKKISTSGRSTSRRSSWRVSKGMSARPDRPNAVNKQGAIPGRRKAGRSHRRR